MKCPKCGYLGFEPVDRCRNCGYDFSLTASAVPLELLLKREPAPAEALVDLPVQSGNAAAVRAPQAAASSSELPLFGHAGDDTPLITKASPPRTPLSVRRATPDLPRVRSSTSPRMASLDLGFDTGASTPSPDDYPPFRPPTVLNTHREEEAYHYEDDVQDASVVARLVAAILDGIILGAIDAVVIYFTLQICGVGLDDLALIPWPPLIAFLTLQNGGYLVAFTAWGQTLGKMAVGIRVVSVEPWSSIDFGRALVRETIWFVLALPAGLGLLPALFSRDHRGLHDRFAGTRVVRVLVITFLSLAIATALGVGYVPFAPGTFGSAVGLLLWAVLPASSAWQAGTIVVLFALGSITGTVAETHFKRRDPRQVVLDEVMGMLITLYQVPVGWIGATIAFLLFRAANVVKPFPANRLEGIHGGFGVMADDAMAGVYANLALRVLLLLPLHYLHVAR